MEPDAPDGTVTGIVASAISLIVTTEVVSSTIQIDTPQDTPNPRAAAGMEMTGVPSVQLRLAQGMTGPVTVSCWVGDDYSFCSGVVSVPGHSPAAFISTRNPGECRIKYRLPGGTEQVKKVVVEDGPKEVILGKR